MQSPEWFEARAPKCKTQDERIEKAVEEYEQTKFQKKVEENVSKNEYICGKIFRLNNDVYDPKLLPGYKNNFALYKTYCYLWDKESHSEYWCNEYIRSFLLIYPERFWYALYAYAKGSSKITKRAGNTKPYNGHELVTVINAIGVDEFFGREMLYVDGDEFYPEDRFVTYFVRYVNAYAGSWQNKKGFESITELPDEVLSNFGITINSRPRPRNYAECPKCGTIFNVSTGERIKKEDIPAGTEESKQRYVTKKIEEAAIKHVKDVRKRKEDSKRISRDAKIERAKKAAEKFKLELSLDLDVEKVNNVANVLIQAAEIEEKPRTAKILDGDRKAILWYLEEFRPDPN